MNRITIYISLILFALFIAPHIFSDCISGFCLMASAFIFTIMAIVLVVLTEILIIISKYAKKKMK